MLRALRNSRKLSMALMCNQLLQPRPLLPQPQLLLLLSQLLQSNLLLRPQHRAHLLTPLNRRNHKSNNGQRPIAV